MGTREILIPKNTVPIEKFKEAVKKAGVICCEVRLKKNADNVSVRKGHGWDRRCTIDSFPKNEEFFVVYGFSEALDIIDDECHLEIFVPSDALNMALFGKGIPDSKAEYDSAFEQI